MIPSSDQLRALVEGGDGRDRAFVDGVIRLAWRGAADDRRRAELTELHGALRGAAERCHATLRGQIRAGAYSPAELRQHFDAVPLLERDQLVEEVLGIAYPPLDEPVLTSSEHMTYAPSGYDEIVHAFDVTGLNAADRLLDLGSGLGKVVMLGALLTGAAAVGVERDGDLCESARGAAAALRIGGAEFRTADAGEVESTDADVVFMYLPFAGEALSRVLRRLAAEARRRAPSAPRRVLCAGPLDLSRHPELMVAGPPRSWLHVYAWR